MSSIHPTSLKKAPIQQRNKVRITLKRKRVNYFVSSQPLLLYNKQNRIRITNTSKKNNNILNKGLIKRVCESLSKRLYISLAQKDILIPAWQIKDFLLLYGSVNPSIKDYFTLDKAVLKINLYGTARSAFKVPLFKRISFTLRLNQRKLDIKNAKRRFLRIFIKNGLLQSKHYKQARDNKFDIQKETVMVIEEIDRKYIKNSILVPLYNKKADSFRFNIEEQRTRRIQLNIKDHIEGDIIDYELLPLLKALGVRKQNVAPKVAKSFQHNYIASLNFNEKRQLSGNHLFAKKHPLSKSQSNIKKEVSFLYDFKKKKRCPSYNHIFYGFNTKNDVKTKKGTRFIKRSYGKIPSVKKKKKLSQSAHILKVNELSSAIKELDKSIKKTCVRNSFLKDFL